MKTWDLKKGGYNTKFDKNKLGTKCLTQTEMYTEYLEVEQKEEQFQMFCLPCSFIPTFSSNVPSGFSYE